MHSPARFTRLSARAWDYLLGDRPAPGRGGRVRLSLEALEAREVPSTTPAALHGGTVRQVGTDLTVTLANQTGVASAFTLTAGHRYIIQVEGTARIAAASDATGVTDGEFVRYNDPANPPKDSSTFTPITNVGVRVAGVPNAGESGTVVGATAVAGGTWGETVNNFWGAYQSSHVYSQEVTGYGRKVRAYYRDVPGKYSDNSGSLTFSVWEEIPTVHVAASQPDAPEGGAAGQFVVSRTGPTDRALTVTLQAPVGAATEGTDYTSLSRSVTIAAGQTSAHVSVAAAADGAFENDEDVVLRLDDGAGYTYDPEGYATVTIHDPGSVPEYTTEDPCGCPCPTNVLSAADQSTVDAIASIFRAAVEKVSGFPVRYADGVVKLNGFDLASDGPGAAWGQTRSWTNGAGYASGQAAGSGWVVSQTPRLVRTGTDSLAVVLDGMTALSFDEVGGAYVSPFGGAETLAYDAGADRYTLTAGDGTRVTFGGFGAARPQFRRGQFESLTTAGGLATAVTAWTSAGRVAEVRASAGGVTDSYTYAYVTAGANLGRLSAVGLRRSTDGGTTWTAVRGVAYAYYGAAEAGGNVGDLKTATVKDAVGAAISTDYYRYYTTGEAGGYQHGLKYAVLGAAFDRLKEASGGTDAAAFAAADAAVAPFADHFFAFDAAGRVTAEVAGGAGCSACAGGQGAFAFAYTASGNPDGPNSWKTKTVETLPDGNRNVVYTNAFGDIMLSVFQDVAAGREWATYYQYDARGRAILSADPSAVAGYDESHADLVHFAGGNAQYLSDAAGRLTTYSYHAATTATATAAGGAAGYLAATALRHGELGADVPQQAWTYYSHAAGGATVFAVATDTVYRNDDGTGAITTSYANTYFAGTNAVQSVTTTLPVVSAAQNGSGVASASTVVYDAKGRPAWARDAAGVISHAAYDPATGAVVKAIADVDTALTSSFAGLPSGWATPAGAGRHQVTTYEVDSLGRTTKETGPDGMVTYTVYKDAAHEVRVYAGWDATTQMPTGPTAVYREDRAGGYTEVLTMTAAPAVDGAGRPTGTEAVSGLQSLARSYVNAAGQAVRADAYFDLGGLTYSTGAVGANGTNYYETTSAYDKRGRLSKTVSPTGTIYRTEYDGLGRVVGQWVGTDDTPTTGFWSTANLAGTDMVRTAAYEYDGGLAGDSHLTRMTAFTHSSAAPDQVTESAYDWRGRVVAVKGGAEVTEAGGVNRPLTAYDYDNLGQVTRTRTYDGDGLAVTPPAAGPLALAVGGAGSDGADAVAADAAGNVYLLGTFSSTVDFDPGAGSTTLNSSAGATYLAKYAADGSLLWARQTAGAAVGLSVDGAGNAYVAGSFTGSAAFDGTTLASAGGADAFVWKLDAAGATAWAVRAGGTGSDGAVGAGADGAGNVYAAGSFGGSAGFGGTTLTAAGGPDVFLWKLDAGGATAWAVRAGGAGWELPAGVAVDAAGNATVAGSFDSASAAFGGTTLSAAGGGFDAFAWRVGAAGTTAWAAKGGGSAGWEFATGVAVDRDGAAYVVGTFDGAGAFGGVTLTPAGGQDAFAWKLGAGGATAWAVSGGGTGSDAGNGVAADAAGNIHVAGSFDRAASFGGATLTPVGPEDAYVWRLGSDGTTRGAAAAGGSGVDYATGVAVDGAGTVYAAGRFNSPSGSFGGGSASPAGGYDGVAWRVGGPTPGRLRAESRYAYDDWGRAFRTEVDAVDPSTGAVGANPLTSESWYDERGLLRKRTSPKGPTAKYAYDSLGRLTAAYTTDGADDAGHADALSVADDTVFEQGEYAYDGADRVVQTTTRQRFHDATALGALGDPSSTTQAKARVSYVGSYYDLGGRLTDAVDVGTNGGTAWTRPGTVPARSDTALVTSLAYGADGMVADVTDPRGVVTRTTYDRLGRTLSAVEDNGTGTKNKTTTYAYNSAGMTSLTAVNPGGADQTTAWVYGVTTASGSGINSNDVVGATRHPDAATGAASASEADVVTVSALGQTLTTTDRNGTVHSYGYDAVGRLVSDAVTTLGTGIDGAVRRHEFAYDTLGNGVLFTAFDAAAAGDVVSQVARTFNGFGQLTREYQAASGAVDTAATPWVGYAYSEGSGGNHSRLTSVTYPDRREVEYAYGPAGGADDRVSRLTAMTDASGTLEGYAYLGWGTVVERSHPQPGSTLTYVKLVGESNGDAGDPYTGLDRFGRVVDQRWVDGSGADTDRFGYGYDRQGNRTYRDNLVDAAFGEVYANDALGQLTSFARGTLNGTNTGVTGTPGRTEDWTLDALGNFAGVAVDGVATGRTHNAQNEVTGVGSSALTYDAAGAMTTDEQGRQLVYDAWGKLAGVADSSSVVVAEYEYDALGRRTTRTDAAGTTASFYSAGWQVLEERDASTGYTTAQYVWSPVYVDALIERDRDTDANGTLDERLWVQQDANWNVTSIVDGTGAVVERYVYEAYGSVTVYSGDYGTVRAVSDYDQQYLFQGLRRDEATGLYHARNRELSATLGRPITSDPLQFGAGDTNFYRWEGNGPTGRLDPSGLVWRPTEVLKPGRVVQEGGPYTPYRRGNSEARLRTPNGKWQAWKQLPPTQASVPMHYRLSYQSADRVWFREDIGESSESRVIPARVADGPPPPWVWRLWVNDNPPAAPVPVPVPVPGTGLVPGRDYTYRQLLDTKPRSCIDGRPNREPIDFSMFDRPDLRGSPKPKPVPVPPSDGPGFSWNDLVPSRTTVGAVATGVALGGLGIAAYTVGAPLAAPATIIIGLGVSLSD